MGIERITFTKEVSATDEADAKAEAKDIIKNRPQDCNREVLESGVSDVTPEKAKDSFSWSLLIDNEGVAMLSIASLADNREMHTLLFTKDNKNLWITTSAPDGNGIRILELLTYVEPSKRKAVSGLKKLRGGLHFR